MFVLKRSGRQEKVHFDKITSRIKKLCYGLNDEYVDAIEVSQKVCAGVYRGVTTSELDELAAETAAHLTSKHPDYGLLAARIAVSNLHKNTKKIWTDVIQDLFTYVEPRTLQAAPLIHEDVYKFIMTHKEQLNSAIVYDRDYDYDYFGFKTLERSYLLRLRGAIVERPQHMLMRVACGIHHDDVDSAIETYNLMSQKWFTHASPTLFNAGTPHPQLSSCFLLTMKDDSIEGIYDTLKQCAQISKQAGGIGIAVHNIRAAGSYIRGTNGTSNGLVPMLRVFNNTARYVDQGGGKRKGSFAIYLEPWHADIFAFLELKKNHGVEENRARDLFFGLWVPDLFMKRVDENKPWSLFCPNEALGLSDTYGDKFETLYEKYEKEGKARRTLPSRQVWQAIMESQTETGTPYMLFKDSCNRKSNQKNLGTIRCSNLCTEIVEYTAPDEVAVCNLASLALPMFVHDGAFDHKKLAAVTQVVCRNLNKIIDVNEYPVEEARRSNMRHRPIGIGVQGLADAFVLLRLPFDSPGAAKLNKEIFETMYHAALSASCDLAEKLGPYTTYAGSPVSQGILQCDMWKVTPSTLWDWPALRARIAQHGVRNSLLLAPMPTASTSQILGNNECFEPYTSNFRHLLKDLIERKLWTPEIKNLLIASSGSVQKIGVIPGDLKDLYKTVWEIKGKTLMDMAADRGAFIDQSQSFNVHMTDVNFGKLTSMHFYAWRKGLKTGMYYLRTQAATQAIQFTVDAQMLRTSTEASSALKERSIFTQPETSLAKTETGEQAKIGRQSMPEQQSKTEHQAKHENSEKQQAKHENSEKQQAKHENSEKQQAKTEQQATTEHQAKHENPEKQQPERGIVVALPPFPTVVIRPIALPLSSPESSPVCSDPSPEKAPNPSDKTRSPPPYKMFETSSDDERADSKIEMKRQVQEAQVQASSKLQEAQVQASSNLQEKQVQVSSKLQEKQVQAPQQASSKFQEKHAQQGKETHAQLPGTSTLQTTVVIDPALQEWRKKRQAAETEAEACSRLNKDACVSCGS